MSDRDYRKELEKLFSLGFEEGRISTIPTDNIRP